MAKHFERATIEVILSDGTDSGLRRSLGQVIEDATEEQMDQLASIIDQLAIYPSRELVLTAKHAYQVEQ